MLISTFAFITKRSMQINQNNLTNKRILGSKERDNKTTVAYGLYKQ
jgi:hypothetical protein